MNELIQAITEAEKIETTIKNKKKLYYLAWPYSPIKHKDGTILTEACNIMNCIDGVNLLLNKGYYIYCPVLWTDRVHRFYPRKYDFWLHYNDFMMDKCDGLILGFDWEESKGCKYEKEYFEKRNKEILYLDDIIEIDDDF